MNIYRFELRSVAKNTFIWAISLSAVCALMMSIFPIYAQNADIIRKMISNFPPELIASLGINLDTLFGVVGFYSYLLVYITLCGAVQAANLGIGIISKERRAKTADFLLTKPIRRHTILTAKLLAALTALIINNFIYLIVSTIACYAVNDTKINLGVLLLVSLTLFFIQLVFTCMGAVIAAFTRRIKSVTAVSLGLTLLFFALSMVQSLIEKDILKYLTPFQFFNMTAIVTNGVYELSSIIAVIFVCIACVTAVYIHTIRQDIHAV